MTWTELLRDEGKRLRAQEEVAVAVFEEMEGLARGEPTRAILRGMIDAAPGRLGRLEIALDAMGATGTGRPLRSFEGWRDDVREMGATSFGEAHDGALLALLLRTARTRTSCYEVAFLLAREIGAERVARLIGALLTDDQALDARVADALARVVEDGEGRWELSAL